VKNRVSEDTRSRFMAELTSFFLLVILNMAFGALAMAFGMQYIVILVPGLPVWQTNPLIRVPAAMIAMVGFGLGLSWILTSARVLRGVKNIRRESRGSQEPVLPETLTRWIVCVTAHYRENRKILRHMIVICRLGGCIFVTLGMVNLLQEFATGSTGGTGGLWCSRSLLQPST
jgi:hypothetical protein